MSQRLPQSTVKAKSTGRQVQGSAGEMHQTSLSNQRRLPGGGDACAVSSAMSWKWLVGVHLWVPSTHRPPQRTGFVTAWALSESLPCFKAGRTVSGDSAGGTSLCTKTKVPPPAPCEENKALLL